MAIVARYTWGKTEKGYGWNLWEGCGLSIERDGKTGHWGVYEKDGSLLCQCVDYRSAQRVVARFWHLTLAQVTPNAIPDFAYVAEGWKGCTVHTIHILEDAGESFATRAEAEAYVTGRELIPRADSCPEPAGIPP